MKNWIAVFFVLAFSTVLLCACTHTDKEPPQTTSAPTASSDASDPESEENDLQAAYDRAADLFRESPDTHRDVGELQTETSEILLLDDGKYYQSYVVSNVDMRYIFVSRSEYEMSAQWDWFPIGTAKEYSIENLGEIYDGGK